MDFIASYILDIATEESSFMITDNCSMIQLKLYCCSCIALVIENSNYLQVAIATHLYVNLHSYTITAG